MSIIDVFDLARTDRRNLFNLDRLKEGIAQRNLDAAIAVSEINVTYAGGSYLRHLGGWHQAVVTTADGAQALIINQADAHYFREYSWIEDIRGLRATPDRDMDQAWAQTVAEALTGMGLTRSTVGIELRFLPAKALEDLHRVLPGVTWVDGSDVFQHARLIKTPGEIALFRLAALYTMKSIEIAWSLSRPGDTEKQVAARMQSAILQLGADALTHCHLQSGVHSTVAHAWPMEKPLEPGEVVHIDFGGIFGGYQTDLSRNAIVVAGSDRQNTIYKRLWEIEQKLIDAIKPGVIAGELWELSENAFKVAGLEYPWHMVGHSTGLDVHEGFEIQKNSQIVLEPGMILNLEPTHIEPNDARYHIEDSVLVTETGYELWTDVLNTPEMAVIL